MPTIRWYVNLKPDMAKHQGNFIRLLAKIKPERKVDAECVWTVVAGGGNTDTQYLPTAARGRYENDRTRQITSGVDRYAFKNVFHLPPVGGDTFTLSCHLDGAPGNRLFTQRYETWRKFYYTLHYMNDECKDFFDELIENVKAVFERANIELVEYRRAKTLKEEPYTLCDSNVRLTHLYVAKNYPFVQKPHHLRVVMLNDVYDGADLDLDLPNIRHDTDTTVNDGAGDLMYRYRVLRDNDDWILRLTFGDDYGLAARWARGTVKITAAAHAPGLVARVEPIPYPSSETPMKQHAKLSNENRQLDFVIKNSGGTRGVHRALTDDETYGDRKLRLELETRIREHYCGHQFKNVAVMRINEQGDYAARQRTVLQTMVHEMGHGFKQVIENEPLHDGAGAPTGVNDDNAMHYTGHGGQGPHCKLNCALVGGEYEPDGGGGDLCVMFHRDDNLVDANGRFCAHCEPRLKRVNLGAAVMKARGWDIAHE
jgi:hypothetical protein